MARLPRDAAEAVDALGFRESTTVIAVGPDHGFVAAISDVLGDKGKLIVQSPPPDDDTSGAEVVEAIAPDAKADEVIAWMSVVPVHSARDLGANVSDGGALWLVLPKAARDSRAAVTEGDVKRAMLSAGWREDRSVQLSKDAYAVRFHRRRSP